MDNDFLTAQEVADFLRIPVTTVYKLATEGKIPSFRAGKHWRFRRSSIQGWIDDQELKDKPKSIQEDESL